LELLGSLEMAAHHQRRLADRFALFCDGTFQQEIIMKMFRSPPGLAFGALLLFALNATPAHAQATRTWVSGVGDDANPCSRTAPCKTFAGAISKTQTNGEINCLDSGGFGSLTVTKSISVVCQGVIGGVLAAGTNGLIVNTPPGGKVTLEGLDIEGAGAGLNGVRIIGATNVFINKSTIRNFTGNGVDLAGPDGARLVIQDSVITGNNGGISVGGAATGSFTAVVIRTIIDNNISFGIRATAPSTTLVVGSMLTTSNGILNVGNALVSSTGDNLILVGTPTQTFKLK
jgi:hypothetical protein